MDLTEQLHQALEQLAAQDTERARLHAKTGLLELLIKRTPAAVAMFDTALCYLAYSDRWLIDYHLGDQSLHGRNHYAVFPEIPERWKAIHQRVLAGESMSAKEDHFARADGTIDWVTWECVPWYTDGGDVGGLIMFTEVVTDEVLARKTLARSEAQYRHLYESMLDGFARVDMDGCVIESNQAFQTLLGYTPEELAQRTFYDITPPRWHAIEDTVLTEQVLPTGYSSAYEKEYLRKDGSVVPVELRTILLRDAAGTPTGMWTIARDITERKQYEAQLRQSEAWYRTLYNAVTDGILVNTINPDGSHGNFVEVNDIVCRRLGYAREDLLQMSPRDLDAPISEGGTDPQPALARLRAGYEITIEQVHIAKDGRRIPVEIHARPFLFQGQPAIFALHRDITAYKQTERDLREKTDELDRIFTLSLDLLCIANMDGYFLKVNPAWEQTLGYPLHALEGYRFLDFVHPDDIPATLDALSTLATGNEVLDFTNRYRRKDGVYRWIEWRSKPHVGGLIYAAARDITERKQTEEALHDSQRMLQNILDNFPGVVFWKDRDLIYLGCNTAFARSAGYDTAADIIGKTDFDLPWAQTEAQCYRDDDQAVMTSGMPRLAIIETQRQANGHTVWYETNKVPLFNDAHQVIGVFGSATDITARKEATDALMESRNMLQLVLDTIPVRVFWKDLSDNYLGCNTLFAQDAGFESATEIIGMNDFDMPWHEEAAYYQSDDQAVMASGSAKINYEEPQTTPLGNRIWLQTSKIPLRDTTGQTIGILGVYEDITARKQTEQALEYERALLSTGIDILPFPIVFETAGGEILRVNRAASALYAGWKTSTPEAPHPFHLLESGTRRMIPEDLWPESRALRGEVMAAAEYLLVFPDGREVPILTQTAPIYVKDELIGVVMALQDISKIKAADQAKDQFLMVLSHELKTPLTSILGWAQAAMHHPERSRQALGIILRNAHEQSHILDDLLDVSRLVTGRLPIRPEACDLWTLAHFNAESATQTACDHGVRLVEEPPAASLPIMADPSRLRQAIGNLLTNAIKFTRPGGTIWVRAYRQHNMAVLDIQDTGQGITQDDLSALFRPFLQLRREEEKGGLGLGLSLVKGIIELHGGHVGAASPGVNQGSTFTITLPLHEQ